MSSGYNEGLYTRILYNIVSSHSRAELYHDYKQGYNIIILLLLTDKEMLENRGVYYRSCALFMQEQTTVQNFRPRNH